MNKKGLKSRFYFVKIDLKNTETIDEIKRVKNTIQRFLITFQWFKRVKMIVFLSKFSYN